MLKLILKLSENLEYHYDKIGNNIPYDSDMQLGLISDLIHKRILTKMLINKYRTGEYNVGQVNELSVYYNLLDSQDYYVSFYDTMLDDYWMKICEKKYGSKDFIFDEETPVLHFSKLNIEAFLKSWEKLKDFDFLYLIITQDDKGWIDITGKQELSQEELEIVKNTRKSTL